MSVLVKEDLIRTFKVSYTRDPSTNLILISICQFGYMLSVNRTLADVLVHLSRLNGCTDFDETFFSCSIHAWEGNNRVGTLNYLTSFLNKTTPAWSGFGCPFLPICSYRWMNSKLFYISWPNMTQLTLCLKSHVFITTQPTKRLLSISLCLF